MAKTVVSLIVLTLHILTILVDKSDAGRPMPSPKFPALFVFGDSTVDTGNNKYIPDTTKADFPPYGRDFPNHTPTGRFSNGKLVPDFLASFLGIKELVPPCLKPNISDDEILTGINFASAGAGYDDITNFASKAIPVMNQIKYFHTYKERLESVAGKKKASRIVRDALVLVSAGSNDMAFNFYDVPFRRLQYNVTGYHDFLLDRLRNFTILLYDAGCRSMLITGLTPIGCLPLQMTLGFQGPFDRHCIEEQNADSRSYNQKLLKLLAEMQATLNGAKIEYCDIYETTMKMLSYPDQYGFTETTRGCCGTGLVEATWLCNILSPLCEDANTFFFWDSVHSSEAANRYIAKYLVEKVIPKML